MAAKTKGSEEKLTQAVEFVNNVLREHNSKPAEYKQKVGEATNSGLAAILRSMEAEIFRAGPLMSIMALREPKTRHHILAALSQAVALGIHVAKTGMV